MTSTLILEERWTRFLGHIGGTPAGTWSNHLLPSYTEPHRKYHNFSHIDACLKLFDALIPAGVKDRLAIELAIWFHDVVYETSAKDNEDRSAILMEFEAQKMRLNLDMVLAANVMILATKNHVPPSDPPEALAYFLDIDMSILGTDEETYDMYEKAIREEYDWVPEEAFRGGRTKILTEFLTFPWIYNTKKFQQLYEGPARKNIKRAIAALGK